eukprot:s363_g14.t1
MSKKARTRLDLDTEMADMSALECARAHQEGKVFTLEHPGRSIALELPSWKALRETPGVREINYHTCMFEGSRRKKYQVLITNGEEFTPMGRLCTGSQICCRTGERHLKWRPSVANGKVVQFTTGDEREYPKGFCVEYAANAKPLLSDGGSFVEIFSGPNAPLSSAVGVMLGVELPGQKKETKSGVKNELQTLEQLLSQKGQTVGTAPVSTPGESRFAAVESDHNRLRGVESGRQPGYGKRTQLIPDGLNDPRLHLDEALKLKHPFDSLTSLKQDHRNALEKAKRIDQECNRSRLETLYLWKEWGRSKSIQKLQTEHESLASNTAKRLGRKPRTALMELIQRVYSIEDKAVPKLCLTGMPIIGEALESPFFSEWRVPAAITVAEFLRTARSRRTGTMTRVAYMAKLGGSDLSRAIYAKTHGPWSPEEMERKHGRFFNVIPSFGLEQGTKEDGTKKYRRIDDHSAGMTNAAATRTQRIDMAMADYVVVMLKALFERFRTPVHLSTEDMQGAYRQVPLPDSQVSISITCVQNWDAQRPELYEIFGQPFGAGHSVPNFYRVAAWLSRALIRGYNLMVDHFFDDFFIAERRACSATAAFCLKESFDLLGFSLDPEKSQPPSDVAHILGVVFNCRALMEERKLLVESKPTRKQNFFVLVNKILQDDFLPPSLAASVVGKFGFLCTTLFGKIGRCCAGPLRQRQYAQTNQTSLDPTLRSCLKLMLKILELSPSRTVSLDQSSPPSILYTDASDVPERKDRFVVGGVLTLPSPHFRILYFSWIVPPSLVDRWLPKQTYMGQLEFLACPVALSTWSQELTNTRLLHFIDNESAAATLVKGYSQKSDSVCSRSSFSNLERASQEYPALTTAALVTDAKALYDMLQQKDIPQMNSKEKHTALEVLGLSQHLLEQGTILRWCNSDQQLSDGMTKIGAQDKIARFLNNGQKWNLVFDEKFTAAKKLKAAKTAVVNFSSTNVDPNWLEMLSRTSGHFLSTVVLSYWILIAAQVETPRMMRCGLWGILAAEGISECVMFIWTCIICKSRLGRRLFFLYVKREYYRFVMGCLALALAIETSVHFEPAQNSRATRAVLEYDNGELMDSTMVLILYSLMLFDAYRKVITKPISKNF